MDENYKSNRMVVENLHCKKYEPYIQKKKTKCKVVLPCPSYEVLQPSMLGKKT